MTEFKGIVRIFGADLKGEKPVELALTGIKGIGTMMSHSIVEMIQVLPNEKLGNLPDEKIAEIEQIIKNPRENGLPAWMLNRRRDYDTGEDLHLVGPELIISLREDLNRLKKIRSYRGIRHELGLPVRGQRTKSSFRKGRTLGVSRKKTREKMGAK
ncbi:MAG: 30S ribosomal protein S13 [Theionarchaea archaeon]|nr:30S ribosomal protein S13 [Theionarchaea archaeon]